MDDHIGVDGEQGVHVSFGGVNLSFLNLQFVFYRRQSNTEQHRPS